MTRSIWGSLTLSVLGILIFSTPGLASTLLLATDWERFGLGNSLNSDSFTFFSIVDEPLNLPGDLNQDGFVDIHDQIIVLNQWGTSVTINDPLASDLSGDGFVDTDDLNIVLNNWNMGTPVVSEVPQELADPTLTIDDFDLAEDVEVLAPDFVLTPWEPVFLAPVAISQPPDAGAVDILDLNIVLSQWNTLAPQAISQSPDIGFIDILDLSIVLSNWNSGPAPTGDGVVPEPASGLLMLCTGTLLLRRRRHVI